MSLPKTSKGDLFRTPPECITLLKFLLKDYQHVSILDPCEGDGRIRRALQAPTRSVTGFDLYPDYGVSVDFLQYKKRHNIIAGNPPFSLKKQFIHHSLTLSDLVVYLLPMAAVSYNDFHAECLAIPQYCGRVLMTPKLIFNEAGRWKPGGVTAYAWFFWHSQNNTSGSFEHYFDLRRLRK